MNAPTRDTPPWEAVKVYNDLGFECVPLKPGTKDAFNKDWPNKTYPPEAFHDDGVGLKNGGMAVDADLDQPGAVALAPEFFPETHLVGGRTGKERSHLFFRAQLSKSYKWMDPAPEPGVKGVILELLAKGRQTAVAPTVYPSKDDEERYYAWDEFDEPGEADELELVRAGTLTAMAVVLRKYMPQDPADQTGERHVIALAVAGALVRSSVFSAVELETLVRVVFDGDPGLDDRLECLRGTAAKFEAGETVSGWPALEDALNDPATVQCLKKWVGWVAKLTVVEHVDPGVEHHMTDIGNAHRLVRRHGRDIRYCEVLGGWLVYDGLRWAPDVTQRVELLAHETVQAIVGEEAKAAWDAGDKNLHLALVEHAHRSEQDWAIRAMLRRAQPMCSAAPDEFDADPWALNCRNGLLDLRTLELREHGQDDLVTKLTGTAYEEDAACPQWEAWLEEVQPDPEMRAFLQRLAGYCLTGDTMERAMFIFFGPGHNGKGTFMNVLGDVLGDYTTTIRSETIIEQTTNGARPDIAKLKGARLVLVGEGKVGARMDEALVKTLTGGKDPMAARFLYKNEFTLLPQCKLVQGTNHLPTVNEQTPATWDRLKVVRFPVEVPEADRDKKLPDKLLAEGAGILAWAIEGLRTYYALGSDLGYPQPVKDEVARYKRDEDILGLFLEECCDQGPDEFVLLDKLFATYQFWARNQGIRRDWSSIIFGKKMVERGVTKTKITHGEHRLKWVWDGYGLNKYGQKLGREEYTLAV